MWRMFGINDLVIKTSESFNGFLATGKSRKTVAKCRVSPGHRFQLFFDFAQADLFDRVHEAGCFGNAQLFAEGVQLGAGKVDLVGRNGVDGAAGLCVERGIRAAAGGEQQAAGSNSRQ